MLLFLLSVHTVQHYYKTSLNFAITSLSLQIYNVYVVQTQMQDHSDDSRTTTFSETFFVLLPQKLTPARTTPFLWDHSAWLMGFKERFQCRSDIRFWNTSFWWLVICIACSHCYHHFLQSSIFMLELYNYCIILFWHKLKSITTGKKSC